jgi:chemotaxis protein CheD
MFASALAPAPQRPAGANSAADARSAPGTRLHQLKLQARQPGEASFFYYNAHFGSDAVKLLPGEYFVHHEDMLLLTTLGSCIAVCLWDRQARVGGMNHFMLPDSSAESGRYGPYAMEMLINALMKRGAQRMTLEAKVFGGAHVLNSVAPDSLKVGQRNTEFALKYLATERIPVVVKDVEGECPRTVCFLPHTGKAMLKRLTSSSALALEAQAREDALRAQAHRNGAGTSVGNSAGSVDLFW